jgi:hypothetical protein
MIVSNFPQSAAVLENANRNITFHVLEYRRATSRKQIESGNMLLLAVTAVLYLASFPV